MKTFSSKRANLFNRVAFENVEFILIAELALLGPVFLLCLVMNQMWPLYMMVIIQILGVFFGAIRFSTPPYPSTSFNPPTLASRVSARPTSIDWKKAA